MSPLCHKPRYIHYPLSDWILARFVRQPRGDTRVTPEDKRRAVAQRAAEVAERRAVFDANNNN